MREALEGRKTAAKMDGTLTAQMRAERDACFTGHAHAPAGGAKAVVERALRRACSGTVVRVRHDPRDLDGIDVGNTFAIISLADFRSIVARRLDGLRPPGVNAAIATARDDRGML